ncbi:MAG TPA: PfkB family carbohydrate kinase, partial [Saprospiraceae bacterium]|nr:PfkB family carbohydrate kinase [Saprospiraceae bacterium]
MKALDYLCIGHCCHDRIGDGIVLGGTASYSSLVATQLGLNAGILTSVGSDFGFFNVFEKNSIRFWNKPAQKTTVFENIYQNEKRTQYLHERASTLFPDDIPDGCRAASVVLFCPIAGEVDFSVLRQFPDALKGATIQGWLRQWDEAGKVSPKPMDWSQLAAADVVIMSDADIQGFEQAIPEIAAAVKVLVMTQGAGGAQVFYQNRQFHFPAYPVKEVDATGAGDVFATAFLIKYAETHDIAQAAGFAHCAASFVVEGIGINNLVGIEQIEKRFARYAANM